MAAWNVSATLSATSRRCSSGMPCALSVNIHEGHEWVSGAAGAGVPSLRAARVHCSCLCVACTCLIGRSNESALRA